jgi:hypothetical protein
MGLIDPEAVDLVFLVVPSTLIRIFVLDTRVVLQLGLRFEFIFLCANVCGCFYGPVSSFSRLIQAFVVRLLVCHSGS